MSETPERRRRAQFAGKAKRLILEARGDNGKLEVEFGTGNLWYATHKVASAVTSAPEGSDRAGPALLARQFGGSLDELRDRWGELQASLQK